MFFFSSPFCWQNWGLSKAFTNIACLHSFLSSNLPTFLCKNLMHSKTLCRAFQVMHAFTLLVFFPSLFSKFAYFSLENLTHSKNSRTIKICLIIMSNGLLIFRGEKWRGSTQSCTCRTATSSRRMRGWGRKPSSSTKRTGPCSLSSSRSFPSPQAQAQTLGPTTTTTITPTIPVPASPNVVADMVTNCIWMFFWSSFV